MLQAITIGGPYAYLSTTYTLASFTDNAADPPTASTIEVWACLLYTSPSPRD